MARKIKIPATAPAPTPEELLPHARFAWGRLAITRRDVDLWPLARAVKEHALHAGHVTPQVFGVRRVRALDDRTQLALVGVGGAVSPRRFSAPQMESGVITRAAPFASLSFSISYFSDELSAEEILCGAIESLVTSPAWSDAGARFLSAGEEGFPRVIDLGTDPESEPPPDDPLHGAAWFLWLESGASEARIIHGRLIPRDGDSYETGRVCTVRRVTEEGDTVRVVGVPMAAVNRDEALVALRIHTEREAGRAWIDAAREELRAVIPGSYPIETWLLAP